jgi:hypothetical protein
MNQIVLLAYAARTGHMLHEDYGHDPRWLNPARLSASIFESFSRSASIGEAAFAIANAIGQDSRAWYVHRSPTPRR